MTKLEMIKLLTDLGLYLFPLSTERIPIQKGSFREYAFCDFEQAVLSWKDPLLSGDSVPVLRDYNIGVCTDKIGQGGGALIVIDVDIDPVKGIDGFKTAKEKGYVFPDTFTVKTRRGGRHYYCRSDFAVTSGADRLGKGIDVKSYGAYVVGPGSVFEGNSYDIEHLRPIAKIPDDIFEKLTVRKVETKAVVTNGHDFSQKTVFDPRVQEYLKSTPFVVEGQRHTTSYIHGCVLKDLGCDEVQTTEGLMIWNEEKCTPPLSAEEIKTQAACVFKSGLNPPGSATPEFEFSNEPLPEEKTSDSGDDSPILKYNKNYAFCLEGGSSTILHETVDVLGKPHLDRIKVSSFHERFLADIAEYNGKKHPTSKLWMAHPKRRTYDRVVFAPGLKTRPSEYNLWQGFTVNPLEKGETPTQQMVDGVEAWKEHLFENVCDKNQSHADWLTCFFAHMIQKPYEKPLVAPVFHGAKGVGKDSLVDRVGYLIDVHYVMSDSPRLITGNFNAQLENCLLLVLNEAFWSGNKEAESVLKNLITGQTHSIERKGKEVTKALNRTRVIIMGNEESLVRVTKDERRFSVFNVGEKRRQDNRFFKNMRLDMEAGGYRLLLTYLMNFDLDKADINVALETKGLHEQKEESLTPHQMWWRDSLFMGKILGTTDSKWPEEIPAESLRQALKVRHQDLNIRSRVLNEVHLGRFFKKLGLEKHRPKDGYSYKLKSLEECRKDWDEYLKVKTDWED